MKFLAEVKKNLDEKKLKRIQANIIGLTDDVPPSSLPWAFPLEHDCIVPGVGDKVWIYVDKLDDGEDYDYNYQTYEKYTEETYKEVYDLPNSDSCKIKKDNKRDLEPAVIESTTYPKNRVSKISKITIEFDESQKRYCVTDESGNYIQTNNLGMILRSIKDMYVGVDGKLEIDTDEGTEINSGGTLEKMTLGESLKTYIDNQIKTTYDAHMHNYIIPLIPIASGPTLPPAVPLPVSSTYLSDLNKND